MEHVLELTACFQMTIFAEAGHRSLLDINNQRQVVIGYRHAS
jgi:hypothetical protein